MFLWTALIIGLLGSFHCAGMCGPIALALPLNHAGWLQKIGAGLVYNSGRIITYMILGALFGLLGKGLHLAGFQLWTSFIVGVVMVILAIIPMVFGKGLTIEKLLGGYSTRLISGFQKLLGSGKLSSMFSIGLLNGILPCGLVYVALAGALNTGDVVNAMIFMMLFGLGTIPLMLSISILGNVLGAGFRNIIRKFVPYLVILLGILFIMRGLSLGIPYVSPKAEALTPVVEKAHKCCQRP